MPISFPVSILFSLLFLSGCGSKRNKEDEPLPSVFGTYQFGSSGNVFVELNADSTAFLKMEKTALQKKAQLKEIRKSGVFTMRNDSIFIKWETGVTVRSRFLREKDTYSFKIGSTRYKKPF